MARTPASSARIGATVQVGFVFRDEEGALTTMTAVDFKAYRRGVLLESFAQDDARVELDATLAVALAADLGLTTAENTAGTGIVAVNYIPATAGSYALYADGVAPVDDAATVHFVVLDEND